MKLALDTNVLAYAEGVNGEQNQAFAVNLLGRLPAESIVLPVQVLGELFKVILRRTQSSRDEARTIIIRWRDAYSLANTSQTSMLAAADLATDHQLSIWDAVIVAVAADAGCRLLLSEDMNEGFTWRGVTVVNPFAPVPHPLLDAVLRPDSSPNGEYYVEE